MILGSWWCITVDWAVEVCGAKANVDCFFFNDTATTEIYTILFVGSVRCVSETGSGGRPKVCRLLVGRL